MRKKKQEWGISVDWIQENIRLSLFLIRVFGDCWWTDAGKYKRNISSCNPFMDPMNIKPLSVYKVKKVLFFVISSSSRIKLNRLHREFIII